MLLLHTCISVFHNVKLFCPLHHSQNPSFHVSLAWCVGDLTAKMDTCIQELQVLKHLCSLCLSVRLLSRAFAILWYRFSYVCGCCRDSLKTKRKPHFCWTWTAQSCAAGQEIKPFASPWSSEDKTGVLKRMNSRITPVVQHVSIHPLTPVWLLYDWWQMCCSYQQNIAVEWQMGKQKLLLYFSISC